MPSIQSTELLQIRLTNLIRQSLSRVGLKTERTLEYEFVLQNLPPDLSASILEVGCSSSLLALWMARRGYSVRGVDTREYDERHPNLIFVKGDILSAGFQDEIFDVITLVSTIEHIGFGAYDDTQVDLDADLDAMQEVRRILKPGGRVIMTTPYSNEHNIVPGFERYYDDQRLELLFEGWKVELSQYLKPYFGLWKLRFWRNVGHREAIQPTELYSHSTICVRLGKAT